jgi:hypothetical protein
MREGGFDNLKAFVVKNEILWPQYYQGKGVASDLSRGLGIDAIPAVHLVGQEGKLFSLDAGGKLEALILELINWKSPKDADVDASSSPAGPWIARSGHGVGSQSAERETGPL